MCGAPSTLPVHPPFHEEHGFSSRHCPKNKDLWEVLFPFPNKPIRVYTMGVWKGYYGGRGISDPNSGISDLKIPNCLLCFCVSFLKKEKIHSDFQAGGKEPLLVSGWFLQDTLGGSWPQDMATNDLQKPSRSCGGDSSAQRSWGSPQCEFSTENSIFHLLIEISEQPGLVGRIPVHGRGAERDGPMVSQPKPFHDSFMPQILKERRHHCSPSPSLCPWTIQQNQNPVIRAKKNPAMPNHPYFLPASQLFLI